MVGAFSEGAGGLVAEAREKNSRNSGDARDGHSASAKTSAALSASERARRRARSFICSRNYELGRLAHRFQPPPPVAGRGGGDAVRSRTFCINWPPYCG